jgi:hypothetical protein
MSRNDDGFSISLKHLEYLGYFLGILSVQVSSGFVGKKQLWIVRQSTSERNALLFAAA